MTDQKLYQYIDDYLKNQLSASEKDAFEQKLETNPVFKKEFELHRDLSKQMQKNQSIQELKQIITEVIDRPNQAKKTKPYLIYIFLIIGALVIGYFLFFNNTPDKKSPLLPKDIYLALYETYPPHPILRSDQDSSYFKKAMLAYTEKDYSKTIEILQAPNETSKNNDLNIFYQAQSYMALEQYENAKKLFNELLKRDLFDLKEPVLWYQCLLSIRNDQLDSARIFYQQLPVSSPYRNQGENDPEKLLEQ